ncbi:MAG: 4'-phosphopantetheinyl transferase superfamily protein [Lachnospiraceae bacterium]|nr:4'-phosphopantetheinyl transferase superfamily protein [Lachnospiraceae bacterium]
MSNTQLYTIDVRAFADKDKFDAAYAQLPRERREVIDRCRFEKDKRLSLGAGYLIDFGLKKLGMGDYRIEKDGHGKPFLAGGALSEPFAGIHFNVSHSGDYAVCVFSDAPVGVDIERIRPFSPAVIKRVFSEKEKEFVNGMNAFDDVPENSGLADRMYSLLWTVKESFVKQCGSGITTGFGSIESEDLPGILLAANAIGESLFVVEDANNVSSFHVHRVTDGSRNENAITGLFYSDYALSICMEDAEKLKTINSCITEVKL